jgi:3-oxoadipate enol-lactonase
MAATNKVRTLNTPWGTRIFVEECGSGPLIVLIHGLGGTSNAFQPLIAPLSPKYTVLRFDLPGSGYSTFSKEYPLSMPQFVKDLSFILDDRGEIDPPVLVGHSLGTSIAMHYASLHPVRALVLLGSARSGSHMPEFVERMTALGEVARKGLAEIRDMLVNKNVAPTSPYLAKVVVRQMLTSSNMDGYAATCDAICAKSHVDPDFSAISCPTLLIAGDQDVISPLSQSEELAGLIKNSTTAVVHSAHYHVLEDTDGVLKAMEALFSSL